MCLQDLTNGLMHASVAFSPCPIAYLTIRALFGSGSSWDGCRCAFWHWNAPGFRRGLIREVALSFRHLVVWSYREQKECLRGTSFIGTLD